MSETVKPKGNPNFGKKAVEQVADSGLQNAETTETTEQVQAPMIPASAVSDMVAQAVAEAMKNIQVSQPQYQAPAQQYAPMKIDHDIEDIPELEDFEVSDKIYVLSNGTKPISFSIAKEHTAHSPLTYTNFDTRTVHPLRYATNQISFFVEKQTKELGSVMSTDIIFQNGMLKVPASNIILQKFLAIHPHKGVIFREYDPKEKYKEALAKEDLDFEAKSLARKVGDIANRAIASVACLGYNELWDMETVKAEIYSYIKTKPERYIELAKDPNLKAIGVGKLANDRGYITYRNYKFFNEKNEVILEVQRNEDEWKALAEYFTSGVGRTTYEFLVNAML